MTIKVEAGAVAVAIVPSRIATGQGWPSQMAPLTTKTAAMNDSTSVTITTCRPMRWNNENSNTDPTENKIKPRATSLRTPSEPPTGVRYLWRRALIAIRVVAASARTLW